LAHARALRRAPAAASPTFRITDRSIGNWIFRGSGREGLLAQSIM
jgi:hypothetical protein